MLEFAGNSRSNRFSWLFFYNPNVLLTDLVSSKWAQVWNTLKQRILVCLNTLLLQKGPMTRPLLAKSLSWRTPILIWNTTLNSTNPGLFEHFAVTKGADDKASTGKKSELEDADPNLEHPWTTWILVWQVSKLNYLFDEIRIIFQTINNCNFLVMFTTENEIIRRSWRQIYRLLIAVIFGCRIIGTTGFFLLMNRVIKLQLILMKN